MNERERLIELICDGTLKTEICTTETHLDCDACRGDCGYCTILADHLLAHGVTVTRLIPVTERLPDENGIYLTFNKKKQYEFHLFQTGKRMWQGIWEEDGVTHWMPLPKPPKGE